MRRPRKSILVLALVTASIALGLFLTGLIGAGELEPSDLPGSTMKTLDEIPPTWSQLLPIDERFERVMNSEAVLDKETGLTWAANADIFGGLTWQNAIDTCADLSLGGRKGWRLPAREELASLVDPSQTSPAVPPGYEYFFRNVRSGGYWSSTTYESDSNSVWYVSMYTGSVGINAKLARRYVWAVRSGH
jgi:hypothetical protein